MSLLKIIGEQKKACGPVCLNLSSAPDAAHTDKFRGRAAIVTLGCAKNQVDSEVMLGVLRETGFEIVSDISRADVAIVNTCGFLESAVRESIDSILEVAEYKQSGRLRKLIVAGCMVERYRKDLAESMPEVDSFVTVDDILKVGQIANDETASLLDSAARPYFLYDDTMPRQLSTSRHFAYVKISDGCDRPCAFCIIPQLRGAMRSRALDSVVREVADLGRAGVREVNLIAQDLTAYGKDIGGIDLADLLTELDRQKAVDWVRLLYAYPIGISEKLLDRVLNLESVCNYIDLPLQHSSENVLKRMKRPLGRYSPRSIVQSIKGFSPEIHLRTTFIVGFPGETESDIDDLESFIREGHFSNLGIFTYSAEAGTPAAEMENQVSEAEKAARRERLMLAQQEVLGAKLRSFVGQSYEAMVEGPHPDTDMLISARARFQAPEVDGTIIINDIAPELGGHTTEDGTPGLRPGQIVEVRISEVAGYDLIGTAVSIVKD